MKACLLAVAMIVVALQGCATNRVSDYVYFPDLARRALSGDAEAFRQVLVQAETTSPGEQLEELAEISSKFARLNPTEFLRAQSTGQHCFGIDFMGVKYVDNQPARRRERELRHQALSSVSDTSLVSAKQRCLAVLAKPASAPQSELSREFGFSVADSFSRDELLALVTAVRLETDDPILTVGHLGDGTAIVWASKNANEYALRLEFTKVAHGWQLKLKGQAVP